MRLGQSWRRDDLSGDAVVVVGRCVRRAGVHANDFVVRALTTKQDNPEGYQEEDGAYAALVPAKESAKPQFQPQCQAHARVA